MGALPTGTVTLLFTDIEGSTPVAAALGDAYGDVLDQHFAIMQAAVARHDGCSFGTEGDALFVAFPRASAAVEAAVEAQRGLISHAWPENGVLRIRMGLHTGEPIIRTAGYDGIEVIRAARIEDAAHGTQILVSSATRELAAASIDPAITFTDLGEHRLKGLPRAERLFQVCAPGLPQDFPPPRSLDTYINNLPTRLPVLLGRQHELNAIRGYLSDGAPILTITGPGGVGKTALALRGAEEARSGYRNGACFVDLTAVTDPAMVADAIGRALGISGSREGISERALVAYLRGRELLLILDNFEHVITAAPLVAMLAAECPDVRLLVTSREALGLGPEQLLPIGGLSAGDPLTSTQATAPAVELYLRRARTVNPAFAPGTTGLRTIAEIAGRLDGLPLAIELAASRSRLLSPQAILPRLELGLDLLSQQARDGPERHLTLRQTIAWSYDLLDPVEQAMLRWLSVFRGGFSLRAVESLTEAMGADPSATLETLASLINKSLLRQVPFDTAEPRFDLLETIREFAHERLVSAGEESEARDGHLGYFRTFALDAEAGLTGAGQTAVLDGIAGELENIRIALAWATDGYGSVSSGLALAAGLGRFWWSRRLVEGRDWLERLLATAPPDQSTPRVRALYWASFLAHYGGDVRAALSHVQECVELCRETNRLRRLATGLGILGLSALATGDPERARRAFDEAVELHRRFGDLPSLGVTLGWTAGLYVETGDHLRAIAAWEESIAVLRQTGDPLLVAEALLGLAEILMSIGEMERARTHLAESIALHRSLDGGVAGLPRALGMHGMTHMAEGPTPQALHSFMESLEAAIALGGRWEAIWGISGAAAWIAAEGFAPEAARLLGYCQETIAANGREIPDAFQAQCDRTRAALADALGSTRLEAELKAGAALDPAGLRATILSVLRDRS